MEICSEGAAAVSGGARRQSQRDAQWVDHFVAATFEHLASANAMVGTQAQPGRELFLVAPSTDIGTNFEEDFLSSLQTDSVDTCQIHTADSIKLLSQIELVLLAHPWPFAARF